MLTQLNNNRASAKSGFISTLAWNAVHFVFPNLCILCDSIRFPDNSWLCPACIKKLADNNASRKPCGRCAGNLNKGFCDCSAGWSYPFSGIFSLFDFDDTIKDLTHSIKYNGRSSLARDLAKLFSHLIPNTFFDEVDGFVALPLHPLKQLSRGYNQSEYLARGFSQGLEKQIPVMKNVVRRTRNTKTQTKLDKEKRRENMRDAFSVPSGKRSRIAGKRMIIIDDVVTTGATTAACAQALLEGGAASVKVLCLARD